LVGEKDVLFSLGLVGEEENKILLSVILIEKEDLHSNEQYYVPVGDSFISKKKPLFFNIYLSVASSFKEDKYLIGIEKLTTIAAFFQNNSSFKRVDHGEMIEKNIEDFTVKNENFSKDKFAYYPSLPCLVYKIGLIPVYEDNIVNKIYPSVKNI
jgi:hypothetical protein